MGSFSGAAQEIISVIQKIPQIRRAPDSPPDNNSVFPFAVLQPGSGQYRGLNYGQIIGLHNIAVELHVKRYELDRSQDQLRDIIDLIPRWCVEKYQKQQFTELETWERIDYNAGPLEWAGVETLGIVYLFINVKIVSSTE